MSVDTTTQRFFEEKYRRDADPWQFATSAYEQARYASIVAALAHRRYRRCFEPGCSIGVLTEQLAGFCRQVDAMDIAPAAVERAQERCRMLGNVRIACGALPAIPTREDDDEQDDGYDLIVFSEVGYYFAEKPLTELVANLMQRLEPGGVLLGAHWLGSSKDHILSGRQVHAILACGGGLAHQYREQHESFLLDRWMRV